MLGFEYFWKHYLNDLKSVTENLKQKIVSKNTKIFRKGYEAVIIDNTNIEVWNMIIYATMALRFRYRISIEEPNTAWKLNVRELAKRNKHGLVFSVFRKIQKSFLSGKKIKNKF